MQIFVSLCGRTRYDWCNCDSCAGTLDSLVDSGCEFYWNCDWATLLALSTLDSRCTSDFWGHPFARILIHTRQTCDGRIPLTSLDSPLDSSLGRYRGHSLLALRVSLVGNRFVILRCCFAVYLVYPSPSEEISSHHALSSFGEPVSDGQQVPHELIKYRGY